MSKARILAVDDQLYFRTFLEGMLVDEGYEVETASDGAQALHALERELFDVVVTDLVMPEMDGIELVRRAREIFPDQEIVVLTGVGDVQSAVNAMKEGATDYLLKPIERSALLRSLDTILQRRRLRDEHARLMGENLEYLRVLSLYERGVGLFSTVSLEALAERIIEGLCLETQAQGGVLWVARDDDSERLRLAGARGLVRVTDEPEELALDRLPPEWMLLRDGTPGARLQEGDAAAAAALIAPLRHAGRLVGVARLTDKLEGHSFDGADRASADKLAELAAVALSNALRFRSLERRSFRDATTRAYTLAYFEDVVRNEIHKASRFGRRFSVLSLELDGLGALRRRMGETELGRWLEGVVFQVSRSLRSTDLIAAESESRYRVLLPETDALGAAVLKRRIREGLEASDALSALATRERPELLVAAASYPADGTQLEALERTLESRLEEDRASVLRSLDLEESSFASVVDALLERAAPGPAELPDQVARFLLEEIGRRPGDRGLLFLAPGAGLGSSVRDGLERLRGTSTRTEVVYVGDGKSDALAGVPVSCASTRRAGTRAPFLIYYGEGPAYALVRRPEGGGNRDDSAFFHTSDRALVEQLAFRLQRDLGISLAV